MGKPEAEEPLGALFSFKTTAASRKEVAGTRCPWVWDRGGCGGHRRAHLMDEEDEARRCREAKLRS